MSDDFVVQWTNPAWEQVNQMNSPRFGGDAVAWHEHKVREHAKKSVPEATRARIRCVHMCARLVEGLAVPS